MVEDSFSSKMRQYHKLKICIEINVKMSDFLNWQKMSENLRNLRMSENVENGSKMCENRSKSLKKRPKMSESG